MVTQTVFVEGMERLIFRKGQQSTPEVMEKES